MSRPKFASESMSYAPRYCQVEDVSLVKAAPRLSGHVVAFGGQP